MTMESAGNRPKPRRGGRSGALWVLVTALAALLGAPVGAAESLTVVSWGGSYQRASTLAVLDPFSAETGIEVRIEDYNGGLAQIRAQVETGNVHWDVVDLELTDLLRGCDEGLLEPLSLDALPPSADGTAPLDDFLPDALSECGVGQLFGATIYAYNRNAFDGATPSTIDDFFDMARFPGRRGMRRVPMSNLEFALLADGLPGAEVYAALGTPAGLKRAFRKLDTIKEHVVWWDAGAQPPQMLADGEVLMTTAYNGRIFNAQVLEKQPFVVVWDGANLQSAGFGIVAGTPNLSAARRLALYSARPEVMASISKYISYSPSRRSALPLVSTHLETGVQMAPHMPTGEGNLDRALTQDAQWWADHADDINERFAAWLAR